MTKKVISTLNLYEKEAIENKLKQMAANGWLLKTINSIFWTYEKIEPQQLNFCVTYLPNISQFEPTPTDSQILKEDFCKQDGWILICNFFQMQIFYTKNKTAQPIETDVVTQFENINKIIKMSIFNNNLCLLFPLTLFIFLEFNSFMQSPELYLSNYFNMLSFLLFGLIFIYCLYQIFHYILWFKKSKKSVYTTGTFTNIKRLKYKNIMNIIIIVLLFLQISKSIYPFYVIINIFILFLILISTKSLTKYLKNIGLNKNVNFIISISTCLFLTITSVTFMPFILLKNTIPNSDIIVANKSDVPLNVVDLVQTNENFNIQNKSQHTFLVSHLDVKQRPTENSDYGIEYQIIDIKKDYLYDFIKTAMLKTKKDYKLYNKTNNKIWQSKEAYKLIIDNKPTNDYIICYNNRIVKISFLFEPTNEQIKICSEKLKI